MTCLSCQNIVAPSCQLKAPIQEVNSGDSSVRPIYAAVFMTWGVELAASTIDTVVVGGELDGVGTLKVPADVTMHLLSDHMSTRRREGVRWVGKGRLGVERVSCAHSCVPQVSKPSGLAEVKLTHQKGPIAEAQVTYTHMSQQPVDNSQDVASCKRTAVTYIRTIALGSR